MFTLSWGEEGNITHLVCKLRNWILCLGERRWIVGVYLLCDQARRPYRCLQTYISFPVRGFTCSKHDFNFDKTMLKRERKIDNRLTLHFHFRFSLHRFAKWARAHGGIYTLKSVLLPQWSSPTAACKTTYRWQEFHLQQ